MGKWVRLGLSGAVLALVYACGGSDSSHPNATTIGAEGGQVTEGALTLFIPRGALKISTPITIEETTSVSAPQGLTLVGPAYDFGPDGTTFAVPVLVTIKLTDVAKDFDNLRLFQSPNGTSWSPTESSMFDARSAVITGSIRHFSFVGVFAGLSNEGVAGASTMGGSGSGVMQSGGAGGVDSSTGGAPSAAGGTNELPESGAGGMSSSQSGGAGGMSEEPGSSAGAGGQGGDAGASGAAPLVVASNCGNGTFEPQLGEQCDDGNQADGDTCSHACECTPTCGNNIWSCGEQCDDGNLVSGDGCNSNCRAEICGNAVKDANEECDDGNTKSADGCSSTCKLE